MGQTCLFTAVLWAVEAGVLVLLERWLDGFKIDNFWSGLTLVAVMAVLNAVLWPFALWLTFPFAFFTLGLFTLLLNGVIALVAAQILPGVTLDFWDGIVIAFALAFVQVLLSAAFNQVDDSYDRRIVRRSARREQEPITTDIPGVLFLEVDGLAEPVLRPRSRRARCPTSRPGWSPAPTGSRSGSRISRRRPAQARPGSSSGTMTASSRSAGGTEGRDAWSAARR